MIRSFSGSFFCFRSVPTGILYGAHVPLDFSIVFQRQGSNSERLDALYKGVELTNGYWPVDRQSALTCHEAYE